MGTPPWRTRRRAGRGLTVPLHVPPGRTGRLWLRERLVVAERAADVLEQKRRVLLTQSVRLRREGRGDARHVGGRVPTRRDVAPAGGARRRRGPVPCRPPRISPARRRRGSRGGAPWGSPIPGTRNASSRTRSASAGIGRHRRAPLRHRCAPRGAAWPPSRMAPRSAPPISSRTSSRRRHAAFGPSSAAGSRASRVPSARSRGASTSASARTPCGPGGHRIGSRRPGRAVPRLSLWPATLRSDGRPSPSGSPDHRAGWPIVSRAPLVTRRPSIRGGLARQVRWPPVHAAEQHDQRRRPAMIAAGTCP